MKTGSGDRPSEDILRAEKLAALSRLASIVGHELRNPLSSIKNTLYLVRETLKGISLPDKDKGLPDFVDYADREIDNACKIIADLLDFTKTDKLFFEPTNINAAVRDAVKAVHLPPEIRIEERCGEPMPSIQADAIKIRQAFLRLAVNAVEAMPSGGTLVIATSVQGEPQHPAARVKVEFKDSGVGMPAENMAKVFEPFFTTKGNRVGLGLAIASAIFKAHGGDVVVESKLGRGSTFTVSLPVSRQTP